MLTVGAVIVSLVAGLIIGVAIARRPRAGAAGETGEPASQPNSEAADRASTPEQTPAATTRTGAPIPRPTARDASSSDANDSAAPARPAVKGMAAHPAGRGHTVGADSPSTWPERTEVLDRLPVGVVVVSAKGKTIFRSAAATALAGTHSGLLIDDTVDQLIELALDGRSERRTLELYGPPRQAIAVQAFPLGMGGAVATIVDESEKRRVDAVRTDFVANISHELRTPVGALAVLAETLIGETDLGRVGRMAERMVTEAHRVSRTIDDLLELSRIELGEEPVRDPVPVTDIVNETLERAEEFARQHEIDILALGVPDDLAVIGDRRQLVSALGNIVENAIKYSEHGSSVQVRARRAGNLVELMVADNGIGIPARDHDRIFERFYRVDKARSRDTGGTGLGLSIVRHVADNHGGSVEVSSQEGEGSTFVLRIPSTTKVSTDYSEVMST